MRAAKLTASALNKSTPVLELSHDGKIVLLVNHIQQLGATIYIERVKLKMINKKALTSGDKNFGILHVQQRGKVSVLEAEHAHFLEELEILREKKRPADEIQQQA